MSPTLDPWPKIRLLIRAELLRGRVVARTVAARAWHYTIAILLGLVGMAMVTLAAYFWLAEHYGPVIAALVIGGVHLLGAVAFFALGRRVYPNSELKLIAEIEELARDGLAADLAEIERRLSRIESHVRRVFAPDGILGGQLVHILHIVSTLLSRRRRHRDAESGNESQPDSESQSRS